MIKKNYQYTDKSERIKHRKESCEGDTNINLNKEKKRERGKREKHSEKKP